MLRSVIVTALGLGAIASFSSQAYARPVNQQQLQPGVTLSGESLQGLESRDAKDFFTFFPENQRNFPSSSSELSAPNPNTPLRNLEIRGGNSPTSVDTDVRGFQNSDTDNQFRLRYRVDE